MPKMKRKSVELLKKNRKRWDEDYDYKSSRRLQRNSNADDKPDKTKIPREDKKEISSDTEMPSKKRTRLEERLQKEAQKLKSQLEKELAPKRGSGEPLHLQCWEDELSPAQLTRSSKVDQELTDITNKLDALIKQHGGELVYKGDLSMAYQLGTTPPALASLSNNSSTPAVQTKQANTYQLMMDPRLGLVVGQVQTPTGKAQTVVPPVTPTTPQTSGGSKNKKGGRNTTSGSRNRQQTSQQSNASVPTMPTGVRPTESTAVGGLATGKPAPIVDLTTDDGRPAADSREVSFNKLQGKTFPSLVVVARPHLKAKESANINDRPTLDAKVKSVLMHTPTKFTEWLIQQGLVRSEQTCALHPSSKLKLGMYSDVSKFPYSGGYVWISECCPQRFVSVFSGSLFEAASHPPSVLLKLIYHWACQTNVQNIVQWVKVDNLYVKGLFTWLRAACTTALYQHIGLMGGPGKRIEVGVISLGTTSQDGHQRQVKVEVLGILDGEAKQVRLRAVEPLADGDRNYKRRFSKILEPLNQWVHKESIIMTDLTVDKSCLNSLGFSHVLQSSSGDATSGNQTVMEYLRRIVPRMFQNTLSLLSRQIIQQFLDELVWREWYGSTAAQAFDNMVQHLAEQTRVDSPDTLIVRLNKIAANPFKNWSFYHEQQKVDTHPPQPSTSGASTSTSTKRNRKRQSVPQAPPPPEPKKAKTQKEQSAPVIDLESPPPEPSGSLETYYYGRLPGKDSTMTQHVNINIKCCVCKASFTNNIRFLDHLLAHAHNIPPNVEAAQCRFCLAMLSSAAALETHINESHPGSTFVQNALMCVICEMRFSTANQLTKHMSSAHVAAEMPYECGTCHNRTSSHREAVDHFYNMHDGTAMLQCPFCLKSVSVWNAGKPYTQNVSFFLTHLQKHQKKGTAKKCGKCALWFVHKGTLKEHQIKSHSSLLGKRGVQMWAPTSTSVILARPKDVTYEKTREKAEEMPPVNQNYSSLTFIVPDGMSCKECDTDLGEDDHFPGVQNCSNCQYATCCAKAMLEHSSTCQENSQPVVASTHLPVEMYCVCGFSSNDGNEVAKHLALCERKSAYPTIESAKAATVTHSMLGVLGLVRKPAEERPAAAVAPPTAAKKEIEEKEEIHEEGQAPDDASGSVKPDPESVVDIEPETIGGEIPEAPIADIKTAEGEMDVDEAVPEQSEPMTVDDVATLSTDAERMDVE